MHLMHKNSCEKKSHNDTTELNNCKQKSLNVYEYFNLAYRHDVNKTRHIQGVCLSLLFLKYICLVFKSYDVRSTINNLMRKL